MKISAMFVSKKCADNIRSLYIKGDAEKNIRAFGNRKALIFAIVAALTLFAATAVFVTDSKRLSENITEIPRNEFNKGEKNVTLDVVSDDGKCDRINIKVNERVYTTQELEEFFSDIEPHIFDDILGENEDAGNVTDDLIFIKNAEGSPFSVTWKTDKPLILSSRGKIDQSRLLAEDPDNEGVRVRICATFSYGDFLRDTYSYVIVKQKTDADKDSFDKKIRGSINEKDEMSRSKTVQILPDEVSGHRVRFYDSSLNRGWFVLFFGIAAAFFLMSAKDEKIKKEALIRQKQMDADYPGIINRYMLYHTAGMNPRAIWSAICSAYEKEYEVCHKKRYAYHEMTVTARIMDEGVGELAAYDDFARRCQSRKYRSFISLLKQCVVKGNEGLEGLLFEEMDRALREKNNRIKTDASEAQTKLLFPMFMMLAVILAIVMIPAFMGMNA